jgi:hypothetical protein
MADCPENDAWKNEKRSFYKSILSGISNAINVVSYLKNCIYETRIDKVMVAEGGMAIASIAAATETLMQELSLNTTYIDVSKGRLLQIQFTGTFNAASTAGAAVNLYQGMNYNDFDTVANADTVWVTAINVALSAGNSRTKSSVPIDVSTTNLIKIYVNNLDAAQTLTNVSIKWKLWK